MINFFYPQEDKKFPPQHSCVLFCKMSLDKQESLEPHHEKEEANLKSDSRVESYGHFATYEQTIKDDDVMILTFNNFIRHNAHLFRGKVVLDLECGVGVLSMIAAKAGAARVIGVEKSNIVEHARRLVLRKVCVGGWWWVCGWVAQQNRVTPSPQTLDSDF